MIVNDVMPLHSDLLCFTANYLVWPAVFQVWLGHCQETPGPARSTPESTHFKFIIICIRHSVNATCKRWFCYSVVYMQHLLHVCMSWGSFFLFFFFSQYGKFFPHSKQSLDWGNVILIWGCINKICIWFDLINSITAKTVINQTFFFFFLVKALLFFVVTFTGIAGLRSVLQIEGRFM